MNTRSHRCRHGRIRLIAACLPITFFIASRAAGGGEAGKPPGKAGAAATRPALPRVVKTADGRHFCLAESNRRFVVWGFNYDHDHAGRLLEDYWDKHWPTVAGDFAEMKALGANVVRVHLQTGRFMASATKANPAALKRLGQLVALAQRTGLYLDITGLGCYHKQDTPAWYDALDEKARWAVQARFWSAVAKTCAGNSAVFCYDLMNEPILPGKGTKETDWLAGAFGGKHFVQRISLDLAGRSREQVARAWIDTLVAAIRTHDKQTLVTVGVIPWAMVWPKARPLFYSPQVGTNLDFVCVHVYPRKGKVPEAIAALKTFDVGKPIVVEETFPLRCGQDELAAFLKDSRNVADGYVTFYWGKTIAELSHPGATLAEAITRQWLIYFRDHPPGPAPVP